MVRRSEETQDRMTWLNCTKWVMRRGIDDQDQDSEAQCGGPGPDAMDKVYQMGGEAQG